MLVLKPSTGGIQRRAISSKFDVRNDDCILIVKDIVMCS